MGKPRRGGGADKKGRSVHTDRFVRLPYRLLTSNAYRSLPPNARSLLVELTMIYNGGNNGSLYLSVRDAAARLGTADTTAASRAFDDLAALGFIEMTQDAHFRVKAADKSRARCWRLTWLCGPGRRMPTSEFLEREAPPRSVARKRMERGLKVLKAYGKARDRGKLPVLESDTLPAIRPELPPVAVAESDTPNADNGRFPPKACVRDSAPHIAIPWGRECERGPFGWWQPDWTPQIANWAFAAMVASDHRRMAA